MKQILIAYLTTLIILVTGGQMDISGIKDQMTEAFPDVPVPVIDELLAESESDLSAANVARAEIEAQNSAQESPEANYEYLGSYQITAYAWDGTRCTNGNWPSEGYTVACNSLPLGTRVYIEGIGERVVEDRGATWHRSDWMDLYLGNTYDCNEFGVQYRNVYVISYP